MINLITLTFKRIAVMGLLCLILLIRPVFADAFIVKQINVLGLQRVRESTVLSYLPVHIGQTLSAQDTANILQALYKTGFFSDVHLKRDGSTLVIIVTENSTIGEVQVKGNKAIKKAQIDDVLKRLNIVQGEAYDPAKVNAIQQGLEEQYQQLGYYAAKVEIQTYPMERNRIGLTIKVDEGPIAKIKHINISGNQAFSRRQILKNFSLTESGFFTLLTHTDRYSEVKLDQDLENLTHFYFDHGYLRFQVVSKNVVISPDHKHVDISLVLSEGPVYKISAVNIQGLNDRDNTDINQLIDIHPGQVFSRKQVVAADQKITDYYADRGHALAKVDVLPQLDDVHHLVAITFAINPGPLVYVRQINFAGNDKTSEVELRKRLKQLEGSPYSRADVQESKRQLANLPYLSNIQVDTAQVPNTNDQVDLQYHVNEVNAGRATAQVGYSDTDGFLVGANITEPNFLGTGRYVSLAFQKSAYQESYTFDYNNPYYTINGISRGFSLFYTDTTPNSNVNLDDSYSVNRVGGLMYFGIPVSDYDRFTLGAGYSYIDVNTFGDSVSPNVTDFLDQHPSPYNQFDGTLSWSRSTLDQAVFPTRGLNETLAGRLGVPVISSSLAYYKVTSTTAYYYPLGAGFIINPKVILGYGDGYGDVDSLPFFNNFYGGGISSVPGYEANSLGPKNPYTGDAIGGNVETVGNLGLIFPNFISEKLRTSLIASAGNIYETNQVNGISYESVSFDNMRTSAGLLVSWYSPLGPLQFSIAQALNKRDGDHSQIFDFSFGTSL